MNGEEALKSLNGFYALAFYDRQLNRLVLARDLAGIKPLLVFEDDEKVCFASEMTGLRLLNLLKLIRLPLISTFL